LYTSGDIIEVTTWRKMGAAGKVERMRGIRSVSHTLVGKPGGKNYSGDLEVDEGIILKWNLK
jgi:hypothetical protein